MTYLSTMAKRETDKRVEAHLSPEEYKQFESIAMEKQWSKKKLAENVIRDFIKQSKVKKK